VNVIVAEPVLGPAVTFTVACPDAFVVTLAADTVIALALLLLTASEWPAMPFPLPSVTVTV